MKNQRLTALLAQRLAGLVLALLLAAPVAAQENSESLSGERIRAYDSLIEVRADGSLDVTETITVHAEGAQIRRGIYRDFPTRYADRYGNAVVVDFEMLEVQRNGQTEPWFTESQSNGIRTNTGNDDFLPVPADYTYTLRYRTTRQLGFFADHDELYWNAIGTGWVFPIDAGRVEVRLPQPVPVEQLKAEAYTGAQGDQGQAYEANLPQPGVARWRLTEGLQPYQGLTIVLSFPKGLIAEPTRRQRFIWLLKDNRGLLVAGFGLLALLLYCAWRWNSVGRDPRGGPIIAQYVPPPGHSPAGLRYLRRMGYDTRCFSADLLALAVDGKLVIHCDKGFFSSSWKLERSGAAHKTQSTEPQRALLDRLFSSGALLELKNTNASTVSGAQKAHEKGLEKQFQPELFSRNGGSVGIASLIAVASAGLGFSISGGHGLITIAVLTVLMVTVVMIFARLVKAPTPAGRQLLDRIEGLKLYLGVAERDELARVTGPEAPPLLDAQRYEQLLPFAVALEVEEAWTKKFTLAVGAAAAATTAAISWYRGGGVTDLGSLSKAIGSSLSSQIASASTPPGSSSGSGGGGSSGGGGGGGGGGGR
jgi:uncharacterized membrane protein YgcG